MEQTADRVVIVGAGRLVREGSIAELRSGAQDAGTVLVRSPEAGRLAEVLGAAGLPVSADGDGLVTVSGTTPADVGARAFAAGLELHELRAESSGLEELYFRLTAGQEQFAASTTDTTTTGTTTDTTTQGAAR
jgi:ABC-2 type transport system ATP-binding protein